MTMKYYRPNQRKRTVIVPTRRFFIIIGIAAAVIVAIVLLVSLSSDSSGDKQVSDDSQIQSTVPALEQSQAVPSVVTDDTVVSDNDGTTPEVTQDTPATSGTDTDQDNVTPQPADTTTNYTQLGLESESDAVKKLQERLIELGYLDANATGYYGTVTFDAVYDFQKENGLTADGIAGAQTQALLFSESAKAAS